MDGGGPKDAPGTGGAAGGNPGGSGKPAAAAPARPKPTARAPLPPVKPGRTIEKPPAAAAVVKPAAPSPAPAPPPAAPRLSGAVRLERWSKMLASSTGDREWELSRLEAEQGAHDIRVGIVDPLGIPVDHPFLVWLEALAGLGAVFGFRWLSIRERKRSEAEGAAGGHSSAAPAPLPPPGGVARVPPSAPAAPPAAPAPAKHGAGAPDPVIPPGHIIGRPKAFKPLPTAMIMPGTPLPADGDVRHVVNNGKAGAIPLPPEQP